MSRPITSIAIIDPIGDFGIGGYVYELAEGLSANGVAVDVYTSGRAQMKDLPLPRHHRLFTVLGSPLIRQRGNMKGVPANSPTQPEPARQPNAETVSGTSKSHALVSRIVSLLMPFELAIYLKSRRYDLIWTQWPVMPRYGVRFWKLCKALGMRLVHTVHNVLPHEEADADRGIVQKVYELSGTLVVHSEYSRQELVRQFPAVQENVLKMPFGLYTMFPRMPGERIRSREALNIPPGFKALLFYGSIRPYKNIDAVLEAIRERREWILIVAGREAGYPDLVPGDPLGRTRRVASALGVLDQVRFIPGMLDLKSTSELFEAADVLLLPYLKSYGSGVLLLGMAMGLHIIATQTGGMEEYLKEYSARTLLEGPDHASVARGIDEARKAATDRDRTQKIELPHLDWRQVAKTVLRDLERTNSSLSNIHET